MTSGIGDIRRSTQQGKNRQGSFFRLTTRGLMGDPLIALLNEEQLRQRGITPESVATVLESSCKGWGAEGDGQVIGFSIADSKTRSIWALFILPEDEGRGLGRRLLDAAVAWLWEQGVDQIWLTTDPATRAEGFYRHLGWDVAGVMEHGEIRFELARSAGEDKAQA